jgi:hypothetical protein
VVSYPFLFSREGVGEWHTLELGEEYWLTSMM